jgi:hypothetical protein
MRKTKRLVIELFLIVLIKLLLEYSYINYVSTMYAYEGYVYDFILNKYIIGWVSYIIIYILLFQKKNVNLYIIYIFMYLFYILPNTVYYSLSNQDTLSYFIIVLPFVCIVLFTFNNIIKSPLSFRKGKLFILFASFIVVVIVLMHLYITTGGRMVLSFSDVYDFRDTYGEKSLSGIFGYLNGWSSKIFIIVLFAWSIDRKKFFLIFLSSILLFLLFSLSGHKSVLKGLFLVLFFYYLAKKDNKSKIILFYFLLLISSTLLLMNMLNINMLGALVIRRLLFVPAHLNFIYLEFFSQNEFIYWSNSILSGFIDYPYSLAMSHVIGAYLGHPDMGANTGFIPSGYAHFGVFGVIIYTSIAIVMFNFINAMSKKLNLYFLLAIIFIPIQTLFISSDMFTVLLTHGLLVAIFALWLYTNKTFYLKIGKYRYEI